MTDRTPLICTCGPEPVELQLGAYCVDCHADLDEDAASFDDEADHYIGGSIYDRFRDEWEETQFAEHQAIAP